MQTFINDNQLFSFLLSKGINYKLYHYDASKDPNDSVQPPKQKFMEYFNNTFFWEKILKERMSSVIHYITFFKKDKLSYNILAAFHDSEDIFLFNKLLEIVYDNAAKLKYDDVLERIIINTIYDNNIDTFNSVVKFIKDNDKIDELLKNEDVKGSLLNEAAKNDNPEFVEFFLNNGVSGDAYDNMALSSAIKHGNYKVAKLLIKHGADINKRSKLNFMLIDRNDKNSSDENELNNDEYRLYLLESLNKEGEE